MAGGMFIMHDESVLLGHEEAMILYYERNHLLLLQSGSYFI